MLKRDKGTASAFGDVPLFAGASDKELRQVAELAREERFRAGEDIVTQGHSSGPFFLITDGEANVLVNGAEVRKLGPGDFFGEMSLIDHEPRSATIRASNDVTTLSISSWDFLTLLERQWDLTHKLLKTLSQRVRERDADPCL
jgi:CRP/FNR family cyclic AMP-dependent transcriptional regulator